jgi:hypothetical protein
VPPIGIPPLTGSVLITGTPQVGETLTADTSHLGGDGTISYQWMRDGAEINGATAGTYTVLSADAGSVITVRVTRTGYLGEVISAPTVAVTPVTSPETFGINFNQLQDLAPNITIPAMRIIGSEAETTRVITVTNPNQYSSIRWFLNGNQITGSALAGASVPGTRGETLTVYASPTSTFNRVGQYYVTVEVEIGGRRYSNVILISVGL